MTDPLPGKAPSLAASVLRGSLGFAGVSLAAYAVWAYWGQRLSAQIGEGGFYAVVAAVFLGLSGLALHPLVPGPHSFRRFMKAFVPAFLAYAAVWCAAWFLLKFGWGEWLGSFTGSVAFAVGVGWSLGNLRPLVRAALVLFATHSAGYFLGGSLHYRSGPHHHVLGILGWGLLYGLGFGAGIGYAFYAFQKRPTSP